MLKVEKQSGQNRGFRLPPPVPGGSESVESLGSFIDNLLGDRRIRRAASESLERLMATVNDETPNSPAQGEEPAPAAPPPPVPGGNEPVTKGDDPPGESR